MANCGVCGELIDMPRECTEYGVYYCSDHRLPENHNCIALYSSNTHGPDFRGLTKHDTGDETPGPEPVEPDTVGTSIEVEFDSAPDVETLQQEVADSERGRFGRWRVVLIGGIWWLGTLPIRSFKRVARGILQYRELNVLFIIIIAGLIATGTISAEQWIGPPGESIDGALRSIPPLIANFTAGTGAPSKQGDVTETSAATSEPAAKATLINTETPTPDSTQSLARSRLERLIHQEINERREQHKLEPLIYDTELRQIARKHSDVMAEHGDIFHTQPNGDTRGDRYEAAGYDCRVETSGNRYYTGGENVAQTWFKELTVSGEYYATPTELAAGIVNQWMDSPGHRENILKPFWENEGIGVTIVEETEGSAVYVTQNFC